MANIWYIENGVIHCYKKDGLATVVLEDGETELVIPAGVTKINDYAFYECEYLTDIRIPDSVTEIGDNAFVGCTGLKKVNIPHSVTKVGWGAFSSCSSLTSIVIPEGVTELGGFAFHQCTSLTSVTLPEGLTKIRESVFAKCTGLAEITLPAHVTEIESDAFFGCTSLTGIVIPENVKVIRSHAFNGCEALQRVVLPEGLECLGNQAFRGCTALAELAVPASVEKLGYGMFLDCPNLQVITVPGSYAEQWLLHENLDPTAQIERPLQEWRKFFNFSLRTKGARITKVVIDTDIIYIPDKFGKTDVALIDKEEFPKDIVVLCSKTIFAKLPQTVKFCTALAFLHGGPDFTAEQKEYLTVFIKKNRKEILSQVIQQDDNEALRRCLALGKKADTMWDAAFEKATEANAVHCIAMLLEYKHTNMADRFKGNEFSLN